MKKVLLSLFAVAILLFSAQAYGLDFKFWASEDTFINKALAMNEAGTATWADTNYGDNTRLRLRDTDKDGYEDYISRTLIKFSDANLAQLEGLEILSASLHVYESYRYSSSTEDAVNLHRVMSDWDEASVTWNSNTTYGPTITYRTFSESDYNAEAGDYDGWRSWEVGVDNLVTWWVDGQKGDGTPVANYGIMLENDLDGPNELNIKFYSREYLVADGSSGIRRPYLRITATPEPFSAVLFGIGSCLFGVFAVRRKKLIF